MSDRSSPVLTSSLISQDPRPTGTANVTTFKNMLQEVNITLSFREGPHILGQEQALVVRDLEKAFAKSPEYVSQFLKGLQVLCKKEKHFRKCVLPTRLRKNGAQSDIMQIEQDSLFRIFLKVGCLQNEILNLLLEEITAISSEEMQNTSWLRLLLSPMRYLPAIIDPSNLTTKLLDILDIADFVVQLEILDSVPEIIPDSHYADTAKELSKLLDENDDLTAAIVDCLNALDLDGETRGRVRDRILAKMLAGTSLKIFPVFLQFLLTDGKSQNLVGTLFKVRNALDSIMSGTDKDEEKKSCKIVIFNRLQALAVTPKNVAEAWLNMISSVKVHTDHRPVDYLIIFMLHSSAKSKKRVIEAIFRKRIDLGLFRIPLLERMFEKYVPQQLMKDYFSSFVEIGCSLLRSSNDNKVVEFAAALFKLLFEHQFTETLYQREMLESLILLTGASDRSTVSSVLLIIASLHVGSDRLQNHVVILMKLLEKTDVFDLKDVSIVFDVLCKLTCGEEAQEATSGLKDEIHMLVRKQLSSSKRNIKHRGIISAIAMAKHLVLRSEEQKDVQLPKISLTLSDIPYGPARDAASLLELTGTCTGGCPDFTGLYYDQLAMMLSANAHFDKLFMSWLHAMVTTDFKQTYLACDIPETLNDMKITTQYLLNATPDVIGVNIAGLTMGKGQGSILLLAPHFKLVRILHFRQGDMPSIDALLGCALVLPDVEDPTDLDTDQVCEAADCLFHSVNWFREVINAFVTQKSKSLRKKVVSRLRQVIEVEKKLARFMEKIPDHKLPPSYFDSTLGASKLPGSPVKHDKARTARKRIKLVEGGEETVASTSAGTQAKKKKTTPKLVQAADLSVSFREMDMDLMLLVKYPLQFDGNDDELLATQTAVLQVDQLQFILRDYVSKLSLLTRGKNVGLVQLNTASLTTMLNDLLRVMPFLDSHFRAIARKLAELHGEYTNDLPELYTEEVQELKTSFGLILELYSNVFSWSGFQHARNLDLLKDLLKSFTRSQSQTLTSANRLIAEFINRLAGYHEHCFELTHAVSVVRTMEALHAVTTSTKEIEKKILVTAERLLSRRWYNSKGLPDFGKNHNANVDVLVGVYLKGADVKTLYRLVGTLQEQVPRLKIKEDSLEMLSAIDSQNFHVFYAGVCGALVNKIKEEVQSLTNSQHLELWHNVARIMQALMVIAKERESKIFMVCYLKKSIAILSVFLSHGIPILEITLRSKPDDVMAILRDIQTTTRFLHHLCCYSKYTKDGGLVAHVPKFRLLLETLVYKVKATLVANNCSAAFWMGNLRNKDLKGEDIPSQSTTVTSENHNSDEELPADDSDEDVLGTGGNDSSDSDEKSAESEVFD